MTEFIHLTELWAAGKYNKVGHIITSENWKPSRMAEFCAYFSKYMGTRELEVLYKFI